MVKNKIFLIEDDVATVDVYKTGFEEADFEVEVALTGAEAIEKLEWYNKNIEKRPDLVLLDIILPDIVGIDVLKKLRELKNIKDTKVLILSNYTDRDLKGKGLLLKSEKYLLKTDCKPSDLIKVVKKELT
jgi:two-component system, OmpR family, alkaline phosphatase synthesis response regulator PhoP